MEEHTSAPVSADAKRDLTPFYIPAAIVIAGVIIGISVIVAFKGSSSAAGNGGTQKVAAVNIKDVKIDADDPYIGEKNAKVVIAYWSDYQCPFCKAVEVGHPQIPTPPAIPEIIRDYVKTGKVKIVFKDYAFLGDDSTMAAMYEHAVWRHYPERFYEWREAMYKAQDEEHGGFGNESSILALSRQLGFDAEKLKNDVTQNAQAYMDKMNADREEGAKFGISGTPGFIIGKTLIPGAVGIEEFKKAIDPQL